MNECTAAGAPPGRRCRNPAHGLFCDSAVCTQSLSSAPPPLPPLAAVGRVSAGLPRRGPTLRRRRGRGRSRGRGHTAFPARAGARGGHTCGPAEPGRAEPGRAEPGRGPPTPVMGPVAGSVTARYLVYFQYLGTDFKYVFRTSHPCPRPRHVSGRPTWEGAGAKFRTRTSGSQARRPGEGTDTEGRRGRGGARTPPSNLSRSLPTAGSRPSEAASAPSGSRTTWR